MSDDITSDGKATNDDKSSGSAKLESMSKEELIKIVKNQIISKKKLEIKINELTTANTGLCQSEEHLRNQIDDDQSKYSNIINELDQNKINQSKLQQEYNISCESLECCRLQNETLKASCKNLQDEISNLQNELSLVRSSSIDESHSELLTRFISTTIDLFQLPISLPELIDNEFLNIYKNELEQKQDHFKQAYEQIEEEKDRLQQRIEDLEFFNEEIKLEIDDLRLKSSKYQQDKRLMETELDNYRRQIEDFEEQFLELQQENNNHIIKYDKSQQQPSISSSLLTLHQSEENLNESIFYCMDSILNHIDDNDQRLSKASSTSSLLLSSDIPTLLHSVGITNSTDEEFSVPLNFESVLRLCTLLIERCRVLQYILLKNNDVSINSLTDHDYDNNSISFIQNKIFEQCKILIHKQDHIALDTLFERIYTWMNQTISSNDWQIIIEKSIDQNAPQYIRLEFDNFKFVPEEVEHELTRVHSQLDQLSKENEEQRHEISQLEKRLNSNNSYDKLKEIQTQLEEELAKQCEQTIQLENKIKQENIDKIKFDQLKQIELSYNELQEKYHIAEQLEEQLKDRDELFNKLKTDYEHQRFYLLERDENIRLLKIELDEQEQIRRNLQKKYENQIDTIGNELEQQKLIVLNAIQSQDQESLLLSKQKHQVNDLIEIKTNENKNLIEKILQLENDLQEKNLQFEKDLQENKQLVSEKNQHMDDLQKQLETLNIECEEYKMKFDQIKEEKNKLANEIPLLMDKITNLEEEKYKFIQNVNTLKQELEKNKLYFDQTNEKTSEAVNQEKFQLQQTVENLKQELELNKNNLQDVQLKQSASDDEHNQTSIINNLRSELETIRQENDQLNQVMSELHNKLERQTSDSNENVQDLKEKYQKMKMLLTRLKKELQEKNHQPKQSLMDLELADYEKTIKNSEEDLLNKDKEIQDLREELLNSTDRYTRLKVEMDNLEQQKVQTDERANKFKALLDAAKKELQNAKSHELERHSNDDHVRVLIDKLQIDLDNNKVLTSELRNEKQQLTEKLNNQNETNQRTINLLEQNLQIAQHDLDIAKQDYDTLQDDFNSYKIRAQSVLKQQQQSSQRERTPSMADKQGELEETIEKLKTTLREANDKIQLLNSENERLQKEQDRLIEIQAKLINESRKREQDLRKQNQIEIDKIQNECLQRTNDSHDMIKTITLQNETLSSTFKEQMTLLESDHERAISLVHNELQTARQEIEQLKNRIDLFRQTNIDNEKVPTNPEQTQIGINNESNRDDVVAWSVSERQQGEGSESANINHQPTDIAVKTLENVLFGTNNPIENHTTTNDNTPLSPIDKPRHILFEDLELERQRIEEELNKTKVRLDNTTELLNESELNNVRLNEQVSLLKDEIRRIERNMDRAESISNLEYLKNVILKFFILKSTPERLQLIPVLVTMLKLSPEEQAKLVRVANLTLSIDENLRSEESPTQPIPNGVNSNSPSWGSYLNIWS